MLENATNGYGWRNKILRHSESLTTHARNPVTEKNCAVPSRFVYRHRTLHQLILKQKNKDDEEYIFGNLLPQISGSELLKPLLFIVQFCRRNKKEGLDMKVITIESSAFRSLME